jgi:hypothetical protein
MRSWPKLCSIVFGIAVAAASLAVGVEAQEISWSVPTDGGTPRDTNRIEHVGPHEFRIRASFEEGGQSVLRHAVSRVDLLCRNSDAQPVTVTVHLDLSGDGKRTDYDNKPESGMKLRDFIFIQPPGQGWQQVNGSTERWVATVQFNALPGETKVGLSPWYPFADYLRFVNSLPKHPHLEKRLAGTSDGGREHWELTITDPAVPAERKRKIFWHAREHAYETWSSFAMEGLVEFLLSDEAAEFRRHYIITLHPMTNVDGVGQGFEYRGGYDFPDPRGTATGRLTFDTMDRLRPDFAVTWHNWVAPRDRNVVFYTDGENGQPTARAWLRFTQLFPSLRGADHRWKDETTPLKYNWQNRAPLSEANPHQYAMKKYGTRVWGWEMPWWNYSTDDAHKMGAAFARAFLTTIEEIRTNAPGLTALSPSPLNGERAGVRGENVQSPPATTDAKGVTTPHPQSLSPLRGEGRQPANTRGNFSASAIEAPRWEIHEFSVKGRAHIANPFRDAALVGEFISPSAKTNVLDGFYDGDETWRLRFAPDEEGEWSYLLRGEGVEILQRGKLLCTKARGHGFIRVHPENPYAFAHADGTAFFPMGDTCYGLFDDSPITPELRSEYLKARRAQRFNFVRMSVGHSEARAATNAAYWAWGGSAQKPDLDRFNPDFFRGFDELMRQLRTNGMNVELLLLNFYRRPFTDTNLWTAARERQWLRYVIARYGAFDNIFLWTLANEYETHPDGRYRLDFPGDVDWAKATARFIKTNDVYRHLVTVHPVISASRLGESPRAPFDPPWRIGEFYGADDAMDVLSQQTGALGDGLVWDEAAKCWTGDPTNLVASLNADRRYKKPVLNTENGYEFLRGEPTSKKQVHHTDKVRRSAWRIVCAGGYFAAGFHGTIGHSDAWNRLDAPNHYTFTIRDEGAAAQLSKLHDFFAALPFWRMQPFTNLTGEAVALADSHKTYVAYLPHGGAITMTLPGADGPLVSRWFNPRTGEFSPPAGVAPAGRQNFQAPDTNDWALLIN